jgi:hypothetical protein
LRWAGSSLPKTVGWAHHSSHQANTTTCPLIPAKLPPPPPAPLPTHARTLLFHMDTPQGPMAVPLISVVGGSPRRVQPRYHVHVSLGRTSRVRREGTVVGSGQTGRARGEGGGRFDGGAQSYIRVKPESPRRALERMRRIVSIRSMAVVPSPLPAPLKPTSSAGSSRYGPVGPLYGPPPPTPLATHTHVHCMPVVHCRLGSQRQSRWGRQTWRWR